MADNSIEENLPLAQTAIALQSVLSVMAKDYSAGFRFDTTALRLLSKKANVEIDDILQSTLKHKMFCRSDNVYFLLDFVASEEIRNNINAFAINLLNEYGCFEVSELYKLFADSLNPKCICDVDDFEIFYMRICNSDIRCVAAPQIGNRIVRYSSGNVWGTFSVIAQKIIATINNEFGGVVSEDELHEKYRAFSVDLLAKIIKYCAGDELFRVEINEMVCYQMLDTLGLPEDFSDTLSDTLYRLAAIGLPLNEEILHTALSLTLGVNFKVEYNIPDQATFRRVISIYYKANPPREWK